MVQDTLTAAQENLDRFRGQSDAELHAWLRAILHREAARAHRRFIQTDKRDVRREVALDADEDVLGPLAAALERHETPWRTLVSEERAAALRAAIEALPEHFRQVILARAYERCSFAKIAEQMNRTEAAVRKLWLRGLEQLAQEWPADDSRPLE